MMLGRCAASGMAGRLIHLRATATAALILSGIGGSASTSLARDNPPTAFLGGSMNARDSLRRAYATTENGVDANLILPYQEASHNSAKICIPAVDPDDSDDIFAKESFQRRLKMTVEACRALKKSSLWVEVPMSRASLIEDMESVGLEFHHAVGTSASLCLWLRRSDSKIPEYATHHVGVGAVVVNSRGEILCVRELRNNLRPWKIPGGLSDLGEQIDDAAIREVMEETGVPCRFLSVLSFRHTHGLNLGRSDLYFVCRLAPIEEVDENGNAIIPEPVPEAGEIEMAAWVPLKEYRSTISGENKGHPMMQHIMKLYDQPWEDHDIQKTIVRSIVPGREPSPIYHPPIRSTGADE